MIDKRKTVILKEFLPSFIVCHFTSGYKNTGANHSTNTEENELRPVKDALHGTA